jgi:hypothetical protein
VLENFRTTVQVFASTCTRNVLFMLLEARCAYVLVLSISVDDYSACLCDHYSCRQSITARQIGLVLWDTPEGCPKKLPLFYHATRIHQSRQVGRNIRSVKQISVS